MAGTAAEPPRQLKCSLAVPAGKQLERASAWKMILASQPWGAWMYILRSFQL